MTPSNGTVKFSTNIPEIVSLAFSEGRPVKSDYSGDQVLFTLTDGRRMYLAPFVAEKIAAAGIVARQPFEICKREVTQGNRRTIEFQIRPLQEDGRSPQPKPAAATQSIGEHSQGNPESLTRTLEASIAKVQAQRAAAFAQPADTPSLAETLGGMMAEAGIAVINATNRMEGYAGESGLTLQFDAGAIERMTVSLFIAMERRSSR